MDGWKHGKPYATVVCPIYQLPKKQSQIYKQAADRNVLISTYTHLAVIAQYAQATSKEKAIELMHQIFQAVEGLESSKEANQYWRVINSTILNFDEILTDIWSEERAAARESVDILRQEGIDHITPRIEQIKAFTREEAIQEIITSSKLDSKINTIEGVADNNLLDLN